VTDRRAGAGVGPPPIAIPSTLDAVVVLARHGESEMIVEGRFQGQSETPLSPLGRRQAALTGARLARPHDAPHLPIPDGPPVEIAHSPLRRTSETAEAIRAAIAAPDGLAAAVPLRSDPGFLEIGQGDWEGLAHTEVAERWGDVLAAWRRSPLEAWAPGGESIATVADRVHPALARLIDRLAAAGRERPTEAGGRTWSVLVAHDGLFKVALLGLFGLPLERFWMWRMDLCGISVVELVGGRATLRIHNATGHLAPLREEELAAEARAEARRRSGAL
jgi:broad specificity phosphatase PhoE